MTDLEIPVVKERNFRYRFFEALPGLISWSLLALPLVISFFNVTAAAVFVLVYLLINFTRAVAVAMRAIQGQHMMQQHEKLDWHTLLDDLQLGKVSDKTTYRPEWHLHLLRNLNKRKKTIEPNEIIHAIIIATVKEAREVLAPTFEAIINSDYDMKQVIIVLAYEGRAGKETEDRANELINEFGPKVRHAMAVKHPDGLPGEIIGKGGNINCAGKELLKYVNQHDIDPKRVIVTTLDADTKPHKKYLAALSYEYALSPDPVRTSYQPVAVYTNNIWDAPAPMRVIATGNSFYNIVLSLRPHAIRNFSTHAQPLAGLIDTQFWSARTIVEDGHQFWRSYFAFDGDYRVYPLYVPIYQDAVLTDKYSKTLKAQFIQLRRWTWGASDVAYVVNQGFFKKNKVPRMDLFAKIWRLLEGHVTWATGPILVLGAGFIPALFHPQSFAANELPLIVSRIQTIALAFGLVIIFIALKTLPPKPARYKNRRTLWMVLQWVYLPITTIVYNSFVALYSQTRLIFGKYIGFVVTEKAVVTKDKGVVMNKEERKVSGTEDQK
ncbi:MAG TPA: glycosyltransferase family 2 protein [Candidatus Saccharimonadales bacterium]|nr:glycosyltransferase family 2 protein [Candidatus Saccharimonadales bacterium]